MIKISTRVEYGLRAIIYMGLNKDKWPISLNEISLNLNIPLRYIEQIFIKFKKGDIVKSIRGVKGGYILKDDFEKLTLKEIVEIADGNIIPMWCLNPSYRKKCPFVEECMVAEIWKGLQDVIVNYLSSITLENILGKARDRDFLKLFLKYQ